MELALPGTPLSFEVTYDSPGLDVGMSVWDVTGSSPVLAQGPTAMILAHGNTYTGKFTGVVDKNYVIVKAVYTDDSLTTVDDNYAQGSESIVVRDIGSGGSGSSQGCDVIGIVENTGAVIGLVDC